VKSLTKELSGEQLVVRLNLKYNQASTKVFELMASPEFGLNILRVSTKNFKYKKPYNN